MKGMPHMKTTQILFACIFTLFISGCASLTPEKGGFVSNSLCSVSIGDCVNPAIKEQSDDIISILTGKPVAFVKTRLGLPNRRNELASGAKTWVYFDNSKGMAAKNCKVSLSIRDDMIERVNVSTSNKSFASFLSQGCERIRKEIG